MLNESQLNTSGSVLDNVSPRDKQIGRKSKKVLLSVGQKLKDLTAAAKMSIHNIKSRRII
jgi:hypothetical protein